MTDDHSRADIAFHDAGADVYDEILHPHFHTYHRIVTGPLLDQAGPAGDALDLGCGTGVVTLMLAERGWRVHGVDHSEGMLEVARRKARTAGFEDSVEFSVGDARSLPFEDDSFDLVACQGLLHHLADMRPCLAEAARVLRPGGFLYVAEPCERLSPGERAWTAAVTAASRSRRRHPPRHAAEAPPENEEGPVDARALASLLGDLGFDARMSFWPRLWGLERLPQPLRAPVLRAVARPWRRRAGGLVFVLARAR